MSHPKVIKKRHLPPETTAMRKTQSLPGLQRASLGFDMFGSPKDQAVPVMYIYNICYIILLYVFWHAILGVVILYSFLSPVSIKKQNWWTFVNECHPSSTFIYWIPNVAALLNRHLGLSCLLVDLLQILETACFFFAILLETSLSVSWISFELQEELWTLKKQVHHEQERMVSDNETESCKHRSAMSI